MASAIIKKNIYIYIFQYISGSLTQLVRVFEINLIWKNVKVAKATMYKLPIVINVLFYAFTFYRTNIFIYF